MQAIKTWRFILHSIEQNLAVMVLYVLESKGSSPGRQGFFMAVNANGFMEGSIGGGIMEHKFVESAKKSLEPPVDSRQEKNVRKQIHDKSAAKDQSGMICSGEQTIFQYRLRENDKVTIGNIIDSLEKTKNGSLTLSPGSIRFDEIVPDKNFTYSFISEDDWSYTEKTGYKNHLFIIGGGHCALALSRLMRWMDFYIRVYDEREDLKTMLENEYAHERHLLDHYSKLKETIPAGESNFVVIMTFGYRTDDTALRALIGKSFQYIGLLGSKSKVEKMFDDYRREGINNEWLNQIHTPVGLPISSQTPEEIAVSIAAEIISVKNLH
jgi:xanthine dehydrogenase accessory factor